MSGDGDNQAPLILEPACLSDPTPEPDVTMHTEFSETRKRRKRSSPTVSENPPELKHFAFPKQIERVDSLSSDLVSQIQCVIIVVNKNELFGVFRLLKPLQDKYKRTTIGGVTVYIGILGVHPVAVVQSGMSNQTVGGISNTIHALFDSLSPVAIINVGVAFGAAKDKQSLGDVLVSSQMIDYSSIRTHSNGSVSERGVRAEAGRNLVDRFRTATSEVEFNASLGPILSGPVLHDQEEARAQLLHRFPVGIGGEMEGIGLYAATAFYSAEWIIVKSICDWGDGTKKKLWQPFCAFQAALLVEHVLEDHFVFNGFPAFMRTKPLPVLQESQEVPRRMAEIQRQLQSQLHSFPVDLPILMMFEEDNLMHRLLSIGHEPRVSISSWKQDTWSTILLPNLVTLLKKLLDHAARWSPLVSSEAERVICTMNFCGLFPLVEIFLLRVGPNSKVFDYVSLPDPNLYLSDQAIQEHSKEENVLPDYRGSRENFPEIHTYLKQSGVDMEDHWEIKKETEEEILKSREFLRRYCVPSRMISGPSSYVLKHKAEEWKGDFAKVGYVSNAAMKIALVAQDYKLAIIPGQPSNLRANLKVLDS